MRRTLNPLLLSAVLLLVLAVVVVATTRAPGADTTRPDPARVQQEYHALLSRPDLGQAVTRYQTMLTTIRTKLSSRYGLAWVLADTQFGGPCGEEYRDLDGDDAATVALGDWEASRLPPDQWPGALTLVTPVLTSYGFPAQPRADLGKGPDREVTFVDQDSATVGFGTGRATRLVLITGCHLTRVAKERGYPLPPPTY